VCVRHPQYLIGHASKSVRHSAAGKAQQQHVLASEQMVTHVTQYDAACYLCVCV